MGRAKAGANASMVADTSAPQGLRGTVGADVIMQVSTDGDGIGGADHAEHGATLLDVAEAPEPVAAEYELPTWAEFRGFVMDNGDKYVRASYPNSPADLIETIWCGVPVIEHDLARVMTPKGEWLVY